MSQHDAFYAPTSDDIAEPGSLVHDPAPSADTGLAPEGGAQTDVGVGGGAGDLSFPRPPGWQPGLVPDIIRQYFVTATSSPDAEADDNGTISDSVTIDPPAAIIVSRVEVSVDLTDVGEDADDLVFTLTAPGEAAAVLTPVPYAQPLDDGDDLHVDLTSNAFLGTYANGEWTLTVSSIEGDTDATLEEWTLDITSAWDTFDDPWVW